MNSTVDVLYATGLIGLGNGTSYNEKYIGSVRLFCWIVHVIIGTSDYAIAVVCFRQGTYFSTIVTKDR